MFRGSMKSTGYPLHSRFPFISPPCVTVCHHISTGLYRQPSLLRPHTLTFVNLHVFCTYGRIYFSVLSTVSIQGAYPLQSVFKRSLHFLTAFTVYPGRHEIFLNSKTFRLYLGPTQLPNQWVRRAMSPEVKRPGRDADPSPPSSVEVNEWRCTATALYVFRAVYMDNFTFLRFSVFPV
jgi:hypothetical protein